MLTISISTAGVFREACRRLDCWDTQGQASLKAEELESALRLLGLLGSSRQDCGDLERLQAEGLVVLKGNNTVQHRPDTFHFTSLGV